MKPTAVVQLADTLAHAGDLCARTGALQRRAAGLPSTLSPAGVGDGNCHGCLPGPSMLSASLRARPLRVQGLRSRPARTCSSGGPGGPLRYLSPARNGSARGKDQGRPQGGGNGAQLRAALVGCAISYLANEVRPAVEGWPGNLGSLLIGPQAGAIRPSGEGAGTGDVPADDEGLDSLGSFVGVDRLDVGQGLTPPRSAGEGDGQVGDGDHQGEHGRCRVLAAVGGAPAGDQRAGEQQDHPGGGGHADGVPP